ncbi:MAG TPA: sigma-70 family RNA polymerase sigma factor [Gemmatimonadaceae bacterium]|nr:sigma-70 family RNA polymerase sigma factor [Gemmatimonadaceae bacterium]
MAASEADLIRVYWATLEPLYAYTSRRCGGDREFAEDVTQETWVRAVRAWRVKGIPDKPLAWLVMTARNFIIDQLRRATVLPLDSVSASDLLNAVERNDPIESATVVTAVTRAMSRLSKSESELIEAFHFERHKVADIAEEYGVSERAIEGRLRRARERLRRELEITLKAEGGLA